MELKKKLILQFTGIIAILLLASLTVIYLLFTSFRKDDFKEKLSSKAQSTAQLIAGSGKMEAGRTIRIERNNPTSLPQEYIVAFNDNNEIIYSSEITNALFVSDEILSRIRNEKNIYLRKGMREFSGHYYEGPAKNVAIICAAIDVSGFNKLKKLRVILFFVFLVSIISLFFLGRFFATRALNPISNIINQVNDIDGSDLRQRVSAGTGKDELSKLAGTFNNMLNRLEAAFKMQQDFIANASHELRTPLTSITGNIEVALLKERSNEEYKQSLISTLEEVKNLNLLTHRLLTLLRAGSVVSDNSFSEIRIDDVLWKAHAEYLKTHKDHHVEISFDESIQGEHSFKVLGNENLLKTVFLNLIDNGCKYSSYNKVEIHLLIKNNYLFVLFKDTGIGIPENEIQHIWQPFYRASNVKNTKGHGIGLSLVDRIISMHNGKIQITSGLYKGSTITITLPLMASFYLS